MLNDTTVVLIAVLLVCSSHVVRGRFPKIGETLHFVGFGILCGMVIITLIKLLAFYQSNSV